MSDKIKLINTWYVHKICLIYNCLCGVCQVLGLKFEFVTDKMKTKDEYAFKNVIGMSAILKIFMIYAINMSKIWYLKYNDILDKCMW